MIEIFEFRSVFSQKANTCHDPKTGRFCKIGNAKSVTGKSPEGATLGNKLAKEYGLPSPENGYYWKGYKSGNIVYKNLPGHKVPPRFFDPKTKQFRDKSSVPSGERGILGEDKADSYMTEKGFKKVGGPHNTSGNGLDGVYAKEKPPPPKYVVGEAKFGMAKIKKTADGIKQMSTTWIEQRLEAACGREQAHKIRTTGYEKVILRYNPNIDQIFEHRLR